VIDQVARGRSAGQRAHSRRVGTGKEMVARLTTELAPQGRPVRNINRAALPETLLSPALASSAAWLREWKRGLVRVSQGRNHFSRRDRDIPPTLQAAARAAGARSRSWRPAASCRRILGHALEPEEMIEKAESGDLTTACGSSRSSCHCASGKRTSQPAFSTSRKTRRFTGCITQRRRENQRYPFPGNVRELENLIIEGGLALTIDRVNIRPTQLLPVGGARSGAGPATCRSWKRAIARVLAFTKGNIKAAKILIKTLYKRRDAMSQMSTMVTIGHSLVNEFNLWCRYVGSCQCACVEKPTCSVTFICERVVNYAAPET
jgi:hypothetical protein